MSIKEILKQEEFKEKKSLLALEGIDHMINSKLGQGIEEILKEFRKLNRVTSLKVNSSNLSKHIQDCTGLKFEFLTFEDLNAYVYPPDVDKNNVLIMQNRRMIFENLDSKNMLEDKDFFTGGIDLKNSKVSGDYTKFIMTLGIGEPLLYKYSEFSIQEATGIILHEIGHAFTYLEMLTRVVKTNYLLMEGTKRLMSAENKEQRVKILNEIENLAGSPLEDKKELAENKKDAGVYQIVILKATIIESESNLGFNIYDSRACEQLADNFAARHGYQRALATGLDKLYNSGLIPDKAYLNPFFNFILNIIQYLRALGTVRILIAMITSANPQAVFYGLFMTFFYIIFLIAVGNPLAMTYDPLEYRITKLRQQINDALKDKLLPVEIQKRFVNDAKIVDEIINKFYYDNLGAYETLWRWFYPPSYSREKLTKFQYKIEAMMNNDLYTAAASLNVASKDK